MNYLLRLVVFIVVFCASFTGDPVTGQTTNGKYQGSIDSHIQPPAGKAKNALNSGPRNYVSFSPVFQHVSDEALQNNKGYEQHPEIGVLFAETPCDNCFELIGSRTETTKIFIKEGTSGRDIMMQSSNAPMHYRDGKGNWRTIKTQLEPDATHKGVFAANEQEAPISINTEGKFTAIGKPGKQFQFNHDLELVYSPPDGTEVPLGRANWADYTAGDDGVYVKNAWPGVDIEMYVARGAVKTNFLINHALPAYADGQLLVRDHYQMEGGLFFHAVGQKNIDTGIIKYVGNFEVLDNTGSRVYTVSAATAFEKSDLKHTLKMLEYRINGNTVDISLPGSFLNRPASSYPVVIDPLVSQASTTAVSGSTYSSSWSTPCVYTNAATVPAKVTITDVQFSFQYVTSGGALLENGAFDFKLGTCKSPTPSGLFWNCNTTLTGTCTGTGASIFSSISACLPGPSCSAYNLNLTMDFYQNYATDVPCGTAYISSGAPLIITVFGHTVESNTVTATASNLCLGQSATLNSATAFGVPAYSTIWMPGGFSGTSITVTPTTTTTYTVTSTDACGDVSSATKTITVSPASIISGASSLCTGSSTTLSNTVTGGTWATSNTGVASIGSSSGIVSGVSSGSATISYTTPSGCTTTSTISILPLPAIITGPSSVCQSGTITLADATTGGGWASSNVGVATINSGGQLTGVSAGTASITYTASTGCFVTKSEVVNPIAPISGASTVCIGGTTNLSDAVIGGTWSSLHTGIATINLFSGLVTGVATGTTLISYTTSAGCMATAIELVNVLTPVTGPSAVCQGGSAALSDATSGGTWLSRTLAIATIGGTSGLITGVNSGTTIITYTAPGGCYTSTIITINPLGIITGTSALCSGNSATLSDPTPGGTWTSSNTGVATIVISSGALTGITPGTASIVFTTPSGCTTNFTETILAPPAAISGISALCQGSTLIAHDITTGGAWTSSNPAIATIGALTGLATAVSAGSAIITYSVAGGCFTTASLAVNPLAAITGAPAVCVGNFSTLADGTTGGTWSSTNPAVATIGLTSGAVSGISAGTSAISYTTPAGCIATLTMTVNSPSPITGTLSVCQGSTTTLGNATTGGTWASSAPSVAPVGATSGIVAGVVSGTATITYTAPGGCYVTSPVSVYPLSGITGATTMCQGSATILNDATPGGTWSSLNTAVATIDVSSGLLTGVSAGTATIKYSTGTGCSATVTAIVNALSPISGAPSVCQGNTTMFSNPITGGTWGSTNPGVAAINPATGVVTGLTAGTCNISYVNPYGCIAINEITVDPLSPITGTTFICAGNVTSLGDAVTGGTWNSTNPAIASIGGTSGVLSGVSSGIAVISYTTPASCVATTTVTVNPHAAITGATSVCLGKTTTLTNAVSGGAWNSSNTSVATVGLSSGIVSGVAPGTSSISYTTASGCTSVALVTVNPIYPVTGASNVCLGNSVTMSDLATGGRWTSANPVIASIDSFSGLASSVAPGNAVISYTTPAGCIATTTLTVNPIYAISGATSVCQGNTITLSNAAIGGTWTSSDLSVASIGLSTGIVSGLLSGTSSVTYTTPANCTASTVVAVNVLSPVTGTPSVCVGSTTALNDAVPGGNWSSSNPAIASIGATSGTATGVATGTVVISYTTPAGCIATMNFTIHTLPGAIVGDPSVCVGSSSTLSNTIGGGTWTSGNISIATIGLTSGSLTGIASGTVTITYTTSGGCYETITITVNPLPAPITGTTSLCQGSSSTLGDTTSGGSWASSIPTTASIGATTGVLYGASAGAATITYFTPAHCFVTVPAVIHPLPSAITGTRTICQGATTTLYETLAGGAWSSSNPSVATISAGGVMTGISGGTATISYITAFGCFATTTGVINPTPVITGAIPANPTTCKANNGTIRLTGLADGNAYTVIYDFGGRPDTVSLTADFFGNVVISGLPAGTYSNFSVTTSSGCTSNIVAGPVVLTLPAPPPAPVASNSSPVCNGSDVQLSATDSVAGVTYSWSGPAGFVSNVQNPLLSPSNLNENGVYTVTATRVECVSLPAMTTVVIHPVPGISNIAFINPSTCQGVDGRIILSGLLTGVAYTVTYTENGNPETVTIVANATGQVILAALPSGIYSGISVSSFTCVSNTVGPVTLIDPVAGPPPVISSNSPLCSGKTLMLTSVDGESDLVYDWQGPNGFTSTQPDPQIPDVSFTDSGAYTLTVRHLNCPSSASLKVGVFPPVKLVDVTPGQVIPIGSSVKLYASGAQFYLWTPNDGTISNPNVDSTLATPLENTVYTVEGMNQWGCMDTASVAITIDDYINEYMPNAFTPNGDGRNDVFKIGNCKYDKLLQFNIYNRWGQQIYHNDNDPNQGWDGTFRGEPQDIGTYNYSVILSTPEGKLKTFKGEVVLIR